VMALISRIRRNSWLLILLLAMALGGFVVMDMVRAGSKAKGRDFVIGSVNGDKLDWQAFQRIERILYPNSSGDVYGQRNYIWNYMIEDQLVRNDADVMGFNVGSEELEELQFGSNLSPVIQRNFRDQNTGQVNRQSLDQIKSNLGTGKLQPQLEEFWAFQKTEIVKDRLQSKLVNLVKKSIYIPTWEAQQLQQEQGSSIDFKYVQVPLDKVADTEVTLTDDDYKNWIKENEGLVTRKEEFRSVDYVVFNVIPTKEDTAAVREKISERLEPFRKTDNDSAFVENNYGSLEPVYYKKEDVAPVIADTVFDLPLGTVYGPYIDGVNFKALKIIDRKAIPDSVQSRHILIQAKTDADFRKASATIDSVKTLIETGKQKFDSLAMRISQDGSAQKGGDLGWSALGRMVKPFNDVLFYKAEPGKLYKVVTQFGVHLVEVTGRKFIKNDQGVKIAYLTEPIVPTEETQSAVYDKALEFSGNNRTLDAMKAAVAKDTTLSVESAPGLGHNGYKFGSLGGSAASRDIIRWAFAKETKVGMVSPEVYIFEEPSLFYNAHYVVPALKSITKPGKGTIEDVKENYQAKVMAEKKAEILASKITAKDLPSVAQQFNVEVDTFNNVNFNMSYLQGLGSETALIGKVTTMKQGEVAGPIKGVTGVYMAEVIHRTEASLSTDIAAYRGQLTATSRGNVENRLMDAVKSSANIKDQRYIFY
ncbi:MAG TPA: peptidylprolyl isomerase, partial [Saprospiraceae bacterium]|nr:peptidylprolyl isomerase [Saprospiraceae bacterium]